MHGRTRAALVALVALLLMAVAPAAAGASPEEDDPAPPPSAAPWLGAVLDWSADSPADYRERLGEGAAVYGYDAPVPLRGDDLRALTRAVDQAADQGAGLVVTLEPTVDLDRLDAAALDDLASALARSGLGRREPGFVRPFPEMNAPWRPWGQRPEQLVSVFRSLAQRVHAELPSVAMVWQPVYGAGYPFGTRALSTRRDAGPTDDPRLDTDRDGRLTLRDDPYGPYWPGRAAVDWVGMSLFHWGESYPFVTNVVAPRGKLLAQLAGRYGYPDAAQPRVRDFYGRFVRATGRPMLLETAALWSPASRGPAEPRVKRDWFRQVADPRVRSSYPRIGMVLWQELRRPETEARGRVVDWRATHTPALAADFARTVVAGLETAPGIDRLERRPDPAPSEPRPAPREPLLTGTAATTTSAVAVVLAVLLVAVVALRRRPSWAYVDDHASADRRLELLLGLAVCLVVLGHVDVRSWIDLPRQALGPTSGPELYVLLSGAVLGAAQVRVVTDLPRWYDAATRLWRRALRLWVAALAVVVVVYLVALLPGVDARVLTTSTDPGSGRVRDLYRGFDSLFDFPIPGWALRDVLLLRLGPSQVNLINLSLVLLLLAPVLVLAVLRRRTWVVLVLSLAAYAAYQLHPVRVLPSQFENPFPLLAWQVLFVIGLVGGWHGRALARAAARPWGRAVVVLLALTAIVLAALHPGGDWFERSSLSPGRVVATLCVTTALLALLTRWWVPASRVAGGFLLPLADTALAVLAVHVLLVVAVADVPSLTASTWAGTLAQVVVLAVLWALARTRLLSKVVPT